MPTLLGALWTKGGTEQLPIPRSLSLGSSAAFKDEAPRGTAAVVSQMLSTRRSGPFFKRDRLCRRCLRSAAGAIVPVNGPLFPLGTVFLAVPSIFKSLNSEGIRHRFVENKYSYAKISAARRAVIGARGGT